VGRIISIGGGKGGIGKSFLATNLGLLLAGRVREGVSAPADLIEAVLRHDPDREPFLEQRLSELTFNLVLNQVHQRIDPTLGYRIVKVCNRHLHSKFTFLGNVSYDEKVREAILARRPYVDHCSQTMAAVDLKNIAAKLMDNGNGPMTGALDETASRTIALRRAGRVPQRLGL
jgi:MinD-like ATPase involved in chromosome partitioning or flagellar assembly